MNIGLDITRRQHQDENIRLLIAQRYLYSKAKRWHGVQAILVVVPVVVALLGIKFPNLREANAVLAIAIFVIDMALIENFIKENQKKGACIQELFDCALFEMEWPGWYLSSRPKTELIEEACVKSAERLADEKKKDWYESSIKFIGDYRAILICQLHNVGYTLKLREHFSFLYQYLWIGIPLLSFISSVWMKMSASDAVMMFIPLLPLERWFIKEWKQYKSHIERIEHLRSYIETARQTSRKWRSKKNSAYVILRRIQDGILEYRLLGPLVFNWFYWSQRPKTEQVFQKTVASIVDVERKKST